MLLSITSTTPDATDLGYLLHKHPDRLRTVSVSNGKAHVFYPEATPKRCTATLLVEVDPIALSRGKGSKRGRGPSSPNLEPYVNDRPYAASSLLSVALKKLYGSALAGNCELKPELVETPLDLEIEVPVVASRGGAAIVHRLFEPLGWNVTCEALPLDEQFQSWGDSEHVALSLAGKHRLKDALAHLFVLLPVLDARKHYWIDENEIEKLLRHGGDWLPVHPEQELITRRYLRFNTFTREALDRLNDGTNTDAQDERNDHGEAQYERPLSLNAQRLDAVIDAVKKAGAGTVADLGCGEGQLVQRLLAEASVTKILGIDVSLSALARAEKRIRLDEMSERRRDQVTLAQGALTYTDDRLKGFDIATIVEVIEHLDAERLDVFAQVIFGQSAPQTVIVTTPNVEYNVHFETLPQGSFRHRDHRFEWTRAEFASWVSSINEDFGYEATFEAIGPDDPVTGPPTQMAVFSKVAAQ